MTIRFFILQAHYRGTVDFSNEALQGSEKALQRMLDGYRRLQDLKPAAKSTVDISGIEQKCYDALDDDFNTPVLIANLFDVCRIVNSVHDGNATLSGDDLDSLKRIMDTFLVDILGIRTQMVEGADKGDAMKPFEQAVDLLLEIRSQAKANKDWTTSDKIRNRMAEIGFNVKDTKDGAEWTLK